MRDTPARREGRLRRRGSVILTAPLVRPESLPLSAITGSDQSNPSRAPNRADVYKRITDEIIAAIEKGAGARDASWRAPWHHDGSAVFRPTNALSGKAYAV